MGIGGALDVVPRGMRAASAVSQLTLFFSVGCDGPDHAVRPRCEVSFLRGI